MIVRFFSPARVAGLGLLALLIAPIVLSPARAQDIAEKAAVCTACHGEQGLPSAPDIPIIWGQEFYYLYVQLKDYKSGRRANEVMQGIVADFSKEELWALGQHFAEKKWPRTKFQADDAAVRKGQEIAVAGQCPQCHLGNYQGNSRVPRTAGQQVGYLERTMLELKNGVRQNAAAMASLVKDLPDGDIRAMAQYLAGM